MHERTPFHRCVAIYTPFRRLCFCSPEEPWNDEDPVIRAPTGRRVRVALKQNANALLVPMALDANDATV
jgi:hypothetical protein